MAEDKDILLKADCISIVFGGLKAVTDFSCVLHRHELLGLIGPNGAGKTTVFNMLSGVYTPTSGRITFYSSKGKEYKVNGMKPHQLLAAGISRTFQNIRLFGSMSVEDNVKIALHGQRKMNPSARDAANVTAEIALTEETAVGIADVALLMIMTQLLKVALPRQPNRQSPLFFITATKVLPLT